MRTGPITENVCSCYQPLCNSDFDQMQYGNNNGVLEYEDLPPVAQLRSLIGEEGMRCLDRTKAPVQNRSEGWIVGFSTFGGVLIGGLIVWGLTRKPPRSSAAIASIANGNPLGGLLLPFEGLEAISELVERGFKVLVGAIAGGVSGYFVSQAIVKSHP
ncbi:MAG: hypothetical protein HY539_03705 [Deltaproteobacteria bacterium]|nr:hypothetical protein [Deltaproteobacteria bacterium]